MRLSDLAEAQSLASHRELLIARRDGPIGVTVNGFDMTEELSETVAPAIRLAFRHQVYDVEQQLRMLGVTIE